MPSLDIHLAFGLMAAAFGSLAFLAYIRDIIWGQTRPCRSTWLIWTALSWLSLASNLSEGATTSALFLGTQAGFTLVIFLLALRFGKGGILTRGDAGMLGLACIGLLTWWLTHSAVLALALSIGISALGGIATTLKSYHAPHSESLTCWSMSFLAAVAGLGSVGVWDAVLLAYPAYLTLLYGAILAALWAGRKRGVAISPAPLWLGDEMRVTTRIPYRRHLRRCQPSSPGLYQSP